MIKSKGLTLTWLIIYTIIGVWGFFASVFALIAYSPFMGGSGSTGKELVSYYFMCGTPVMLFVSLVLAWHYYGKKQFERVWYVAPGMAVAYFGAMFVASFF